jgi:glyoxylase-like metal-dependent hydrolase (beta-lactamase superfamily II)
MAEAKRIVPNKPIRYLVSTHHHFDHAAGLAVYASSGVTIVTDKSNEAYWKKLFKGVKVQPVSDKYVITDRNQTMEVYATKGDEHSEELIIAYLPKPKILTEADSYSPGPAGTAAPNPVPPGATALWGNIESRKLEVATIVGVHGRGAVPFSEFKTFVGR